MGRPKKSAEEKKQNKLQYNIEYQKNNTKRFIIQVNKKTESDIIDHLVKKKQYGRYIKDLIKKDMEG